MYYKLLFIVSRNLEDLSNLSDLEGLTRNLIQKGYSEQQILERIVQEYQDFKDIDNSLAFKFARAFCKRIT